MGETAAFFFPHPFIIFFLRHAYLSGHKNLHAFLIPLLTEAFFRKKSHNPISLWFKRLIKFRVTHLSSVNIFKGDETLS